MIPVSIKHNIKDQAGLTITGVREVLGGSINRTAKLTTDRGEYFLKWNKNAPDDFFEREAEGLKALRNAVHSLIIPTVEMVGQTDDSETGFLLMEYIEESRSGDSFQFGSELARLHQNTANQFGFHSDNYIGSLPQSNRMHSNWIEFFISERIEPQLAMATESGKLSSSIRRNWNRLSSRLNELFPACKPSLLHGDLWSGNYLFNKSGKAVIIDPAVYYGHPEMDLAFSTLFGGFTYDFYEGYESISPLENGFDNRVPIFNLYPLLVHVNLFGGSYVDQVKTILQKYS